MDDNFAIRKAYHEQQVAFNEMDAARAKMLKLQTEQTEMYHRIGDLQEQYDTAKAEQDAAWGEYNSEALKLKELIGEKITSGKEAAALEENLRLMAGDPNEKRAKIAVYLKGADFFGKLNLENMTERDKLIDKKRDLIRPDNSRCTMLLDKLKKSRAEQAELLEQYHTAKSDFSLKKANFDRLNAKYRKLNNPEDKTFSDSVLTSRPQKIFEESLLAKANIPEEYWEGCSMERRIDGRVDIYYGCDAETRHGHVVMNGDNIEYVRQPQKSANL